MINCLKIGLLILIITYNLINPQINAHAQLGTTPPPPSCASKGVSIQSTNVPINSIPQASVPSITFTFTGLTDNTQGYYLNFENITTSPPAIPSSGQITLTVGKIDTLGVRGYQGWLWSDGVDASGNFTNVTAPFCSGIDITINGPTVAGAGDPCVAVGNGAGVNTAIGCIGYDPQSFISAILKWILGFAGGVALLLMISASFQILTSAGNPDALKAGQEQFTSAIIGLLFVLFSVTLLQIIGIDILNIPGLSFK